MRIRSGGGRRSGEPHGAAFERRGERGRKISQRSKKRITWLVVEVGSRASAWRQAATDAQLAFEWWRSAAQGDRVTAAAVYMAAIEREEKAANEYSAALEACWSTAP